MWEFDPRRKPLPFDARRSRQGSCKETLKGFADSGSRRVGSGVRLSARVSRRTMATTTSTGLQPFRTDIPARLDRLPWSRWHWLVVVSLGITWVIDGIEVTLVGAVSTVLQEPQTLHFSATQIGLLNTAYLIGAVIGALFFGYLTDRYGRKRLFSITLGVYLAAAFLTAFSWNFASFATFRFLTGAGIGGEYAAINSAIDELIPARVRGWADLAINGTFWVGAALGSLATVVLLDPRLLPVNLGWRLGFGLGALIGLGVILLRHWVPESPRWLLTHGRREEAERVVDDVERTVERESRVEPLPAAEGAINIRPGTHIGFRSLVSTLFHRYPKRTVLCLALVMSQAFLYNGVAFSFGLILKRFYEVSADRVGLYLLPFALTNFLGPLVLGRLFDTVGRRRMIAGTLLVGAALLVLNGFLFASGRLTAGTQTGLWAAIFFFASAAASAAYLTVSEIFPLELRGMVIALFYASGTGMGGPLASWLFGRLIDTGSRRLLSYGDLLAAGLLLATSMVVLAFGVNAERASLEQIAKPLSSTDEVPEPA
jgi:MFS family permease